MQVNSKVTLLRYTANPEATVALAAKICYSEMDGGQLLDSVDSADNGRFIARLLSLGHMSPFEHASFTFLIEGVSRAFLAQITRHRIASFSVRSQRYVDGSDFDYIVPPCIEGLGEQAVERYKQQIATMLEWYRDWQQALGGKGEKANEDARFVLPNAIATQMVVTMNARELLHFFALRCCNRAQWEIRDVAWSMLSQCYAVAPSLFGTGGPTCLDGRCSEGKMSCGKPPFDRRSFVGK